MLDNRLHACGAKVSSSIKITMPGCRMALTSAPSSQIVPPLLQPHPPIRVSTSVWRVIWISVNGRPNAARSCSGSVLLPVPDGPASHVFAPRSTLS